MNLRDLIFRLTGLHVYKKLPRGVDVSRDIARELPSYEIRTIFDVGANVGKTALFFSDRYPNAEIYCFEPVSATFAQLQHNLSGRSALHCLKIGLGSVPGEAQISGHADPAMFSLAQNASTGASSEIVEITTIDDFCGRRGIGKLQYLKIDTEGLDLEVLKGAARMLSAREIDFVEVEAGMNPSNTWHVPFETLKGHLEAKGYLLFGLYEQVREWPTKQPNLRRANAVFISPRLIATPTSNAAA